MSEEIKFACPSCGQHIQCDVAYIGRKISCPMCRAEIGVPRTSPGQTGDSLPKADLIAAPGGLTSAPAQAVERKPVISNPAGKAEALPLEKNTDSRGSKPRVPGATRAAESASEPRRPADVSAAAGPGPEVHLLCPVCHSELSVPADIPPKATSKDLPNATLVRRSEQTTGASPARRKDTPGDAEEKRSEPRPASIEERIGRPGGTMKPRLSYILTGEPPKPTAESKSNPKT
jgi:hypothetical protein